MDQKVISDQLLWNQEKNSSLDQQQPEPLQIKEEQMDLCTSQDEEQLVLKEEADTCMMPQNKPKSEQAVVTRNVQYEEETDPQHRLLDVTREPIIMLHRIGT